MYGQRYPMVCYANCDFECEGAGQRPKRGQSPVGNRGRFVCLAKRNDEALEGGLRANDGVKILSRLLKA